MIRVASYNLYLGADLAVLFGATDAADLDRRVRAVHAQLRATSAAERAEAVARVLARHRPDLVGVQELTTLAARTGDGGERVFSDFRAQLTDALDRAGCAYDVHAVGCSFAGAMPVPGHGVLALTGQNAVLVRRDGPVRVDAEQTGRFGRTLEVRTRVAGLSFPIQRGWVAVTCRAGGRAFRFVNTHLEVYDEATRDAQRDELLDVLGDGPVVVVGDFNATPERLAMPADLTDAWVAGGGPGPGHTCGQAVDLANPVSGLSQRIDYVFVRGLEVVGCAVVGADPEDRTLPGKLWPSDHAAVLATLSLPGT